MIPFFILLGLIAVIVVWVIGIYNSLVSLRNRVKEAWAQVDVQLKRRFDLIPNLLETVKGYMKHERETLEAVTQARAAVSNAGGDMAARMAAEGGLTGALGNSGYTFASASGIPTVRDDGKVDVENNGAKGVFPNGGRYIEGDIRQADPHFILWIAGPQLPIAAQVRVNR